MKGHVFDKTPSLATIRPGPRARRNSTAARFALDPVLGEQMPYVTYYLAIIITGWAFGLGPSILCLTLSALGAHYFFVPPRGAFVIEGAPVRWEPSSLGRQRYDRISIRIPCATGQVSEERADRLARIEIELRREKRVLMSILNSMAERVSVVDHAGSLILFNEALGAHGRQVRNNVHRGACPS